MKGKLMPLLCVEETRLDDALSVGEVKMMSKQTEEP